MKKLFFTLMMAGIIFSANAQQKKVLVAYFSCTGTTKTVAEAIAKTTKGDLYRITPQQPYTDADLNWRNKKSRSSLEMADSQSRPKLADIKANIEAYDVIFVGYPIWWNKCPTIINTFLEAYNFEGKTVIPFATSGGSTFENSEKELKALYNKNINWKPGRLLNRDDKQTSEWAKAFNR